MGRGHEQVPAPPVKRVLLIEDNLGDAEIVRYFLQPSDAGAVRLPRSNVRGVSFEIEHVMTVGEALARLQDGGIDLVISDLTLPDSSGTDTVKAVREAFPGLPLVVLTSIDDERVGVEAVHMGAQDYFVKGSHEQIDLFRACRYALERQHLLVSLRLHAQQAEAREARIRAAVERLQEGFRSLGEGDFTVRLATDSQREELGEMLASVLESFDQTVGRLQTMNELNAQFQSMVTQDLKTPLSTIRLTTQSLLEGDIDLEEGKPYLEIVSRNTDRVLQIVESLLTLSVIEAGQLYVAREVISMTQVVQECGRNMGRLAQAHGHDVEVEVCEEELFVRGDRAKIMQVVENLVSNCVKYCHENDRILLKVHLAADGSVQVDVIDNGPGLSEEERARVFERFRRGDAVRDRVHGLGLAICKEYVEAHGGRIWVTSRPGEGACFSFLLPRSTGVVRESEARVL